MTNYVGAWLAALAAEEQAVYGYGLVGPHLPTQQAIALAEQCQAAHAALQDATSAALVLAGLVPPPPPADYPDLYPVSMGDSALRLALELEQDAATAWRFLFAQASHDSGAQARAVLAQAQDALTASAVRAMGWRRLRSPSAATVAFPGI